MESFPGNSQSAKPEPREKKIEQVTTSKVIQRKKPLGKRFAETFIGGDARGTVGYVLEGILVPAAKDMIAEALTQGFERMIFGESRSGNRRSPYRTSSPARTHTSYSRMANPPIAPAREEARGISRRARTTHDFDEIVLATRIEAETVIGRLSDLIQQYDVVTVNDLYELVGITPSYQDGNWGWSDISTAGIERVHGGGYLLDLPRPQPVD